MLLLFVLAVLYSAVKLVLGGFCGLYKLLKKKKPETSRLNGLGLLSCLAVMASGMLAYSLVLAEGYTVYGGTAAKCVALSILALVPCIHGIMLFGNKAQQAPKRKKIANALAFLTGLIVLGNVIYWQWFDFWSL